MKNIEDLIENENESTYLDFKKIHYSPVKSIAFIKDIIAFANSHISDDKYIIIGVKNEPGKSKEFVGIEQISDVSEFEQIVKEYVDPIIPIDYSAYTYKDKTFGVIRLYNCNSKPYILKKELCINNRQRINEGDSWIRKGTCNFRMTRNDFENIYMQRANHLKIERDEVKRELRIASDELLFIQLLMEEYRLFNKRSDAFYNNVKKCKAADPMFLPYSSNINIDRGEYESKYYKNKIAQLVDNYEYSYDKKHFLELISEISSANRRFYISELLFLEHKQYAMNNHIKKVQMFEKAYNDKILNGINSSQSITPKEAFFDIKRIIENICVPEILRNNDFYSNSVETDDFLITESRFQKRIDELNKHIEDLGNKLRNI